MTQGERIRHIRQTQSLTLEKFGKRLGVGKTAISKLENNDRNLTDQMLKAISREFGVNEDWLRTGEGDPYIKRTRNQEIAAFMNDVMDLPDEAFKKEFIDRIRRLDEKDWEAIANIVDKLLKEG